MKQFDDFQVAASLRWPALVSAIEVMLGDQANAPARSTHILNAAGGAQGHFLVMPAWQNDEVIGVKLVTIWTDNEDRGLASHGATYVLLDARTCRVHAMMAAEALTNRRTAALSLIAAQRLLPSEALRLLVVGSGPVAEHLVMAHASTGRFSSIEIAGRSAARAEALLKRLAGADIACARAANLEEAVRAADMVATATNAAVPIVHGDWLKPNAHVALFGSFTPQMRESDDAVMHRAAEIWVDTHAATTTSGDLVGSLAQGAIELSSIRGDLTALVQRGEEKCSGITVFKSVGIAAADLAAAKLVFAGDAPTSDRGHVRVGLAS